MGHGDRPITAAASCRPDRPLLDALFPPFCSGVPPNHPPHRLQLLGCACLLIACKFEETICPTPANFTFAADESFTRAELLQMERKVVSSLRFRVHSVNTYSFLNRFTRAAGSLQKETALVHYLCELMLLHYEFLAFSPSMRAAAALNLARQTLCLSPDLVWTPTIQYYSGYRAKDLERCVRLLHRAHANAPFIPFRALTEKFSESRALHVAELSPLRVEDLFPATTTA